MLLPQVDGNFEMEKIYFFIKYDKRVFKMISIKDF